ncbi:ATP-binding protein [Rubellimicrobium sp. CFH 75288]|uniref:ATP-binding protein n=1 Tax=Rubellimicrobium sp. CFH 75288 TaxID=2697034 RepID=UPI00352B127A
MSLPPRPALAIPLPLSVLVAGCLALAAAPIAAASWLRLGLTLLGVTLFATAALLALAEGQRRRRCRNVARSLSLLAEHDAIPTLLADRLGEVHWRNPAARAAGTGGRTATAFLETMIAAPGALVARLQDRAEQTGWAAEDLITRRGHLRVSVRTAHEDLFVWRFEDLGARPDQRRATDALTLPMIVAGPAGTILYMNEAARSLIGGRPRHVDAVLGAAPLVSGRNHTLRTAEGPVDCLLAVVNGPGGRREIYLLPASASLPPSAAQWAVIETLPIPLLKVSRTGEVLAANRSARALIPVPVPQGTRLSDLLEGLGRPVAEWVADVAEGRAAAGPQFLRGRGEHQDWFLRVTLTLAGPAEDLHLLAILDDVTELKALEAQFVQSQKMQALGQLAGGVAHDFNNLLTAISGHCDLLLLRHDERTPDYADLIQIRQNANRAASLVDQLLSFSRKQNLLPETFDLRDTLSDLTHLLNRLTGERIRLTLDHDPDLHAVRADRRQLEQVIMNLVVNARDAMPDGGEIRIETGNVLLPQPVTRDRAVIPAGRWVTVQVHDQGIGIPPERLPKIFEPFYTTKRPGEGTGLGLSMAYGIIKQTGGFIFATSEPGRGSTFTIWLPAHDWPDPAPPVPGPAEGAVPRRQGSVLLVEDEAPVRAFASRALRLRGHRVIEADSAEAALAILEDPEVAVDLFVTDVVMPGRDGPSWVREAITRRPGTRVVFVSGYAEDDFAEHKAMVPHSVFLAKPFSLQDLTDVVRDQLALIGAEAVTPDDAPAPPDGRRSRSAQPSRPPPHRPGTAP